MCVCICETARQLGPPETWTFSYTVIASKKTDNNSLTFLLRIFLILFPFLHTDFRYTCLIPETGPFKNRDVFVFDYMTWSWHLLVRSLHIRRMVCLSIYKLFLRVLQEHLEAVF